MTSIKDVRDFGVDLSGAVDNASELRAARASAVANGHALHCPTGLYNDGGTIFERTWPMDWLPQGGQAAGTGYWRLDQRVYFAQMEVPENENIVGHHYVIDVTSPDALAAPFRSTLNVSAGAGSTNFYAQPISYGGAAWLAGYHVEARSESGTVIGFNSETRIYDPAAKAYGMVVKMSSASARALDDRHPVTDADPVYAPGAVGIYFEGNADTDAEKGGWPRGVVFTEKSMRYDGTVIDVLAPEVASVLRTAPGSKSTVADIHLQGDSEYGLRLDGDYTEAAIKVNTGQWVALSTDGKIRMRHQGGGNTIGFFNGNVQRFGFRMNASPALQINGKDVVGERQPGITNAPASVSGASTINAILGAMRAHGLIEGA